MILKKKDFLHSDSFADFDFSAVIFHLYDNQEKGFKRIVKSAFLEALKEYRCYCFFLIGHVNTSRIEKRKNEIRLANIVNGAEVGYLKMDDGVFACFEVDLSNFETVYGDMYEFIFSQQTDFISTISYDLESSSYDTFVSLLLNLTHPNNFLGDVNPISSQYYTPLLERCRKGDIILKACFAEIYSERKILSILHQKGSECPIVMDLGKEKTQPGDD